MIYNKTSKEQKMRKTIENLWYEFESDNGRNQSRESIPLREALIEKGGALREGLNSEQLKKLEAYEESIYAQEAFFEFEAFRKGVSFAVKFILESLSEK